MIVVEIHFCKYYICVEIFINENVATYEVTILGKDKKFYKFKWQVEKYNKDGPLKGCWLTTAVLAPKILGSSV